MKVGSPVRAAAPTFRGPSFLTKTDSVAQILRGEIVRGDLPPGAPLLQNEVARRFGVSSTPVREAFVVLESEGFVRKRAHHGVLVTERNAADLLDVYEMRMILERHAFRRAIRGKAKTQPRRRAALAPRPPRASARPRRRSA